MQHWKMMEQAARLEKQQDRAERLSNSVWFVVFQL